MARWDGVAERRVPTGIGAVFYFLRTRLGGLWAVSWQLSRTQPLGAIGAVFILLLVVLAIFGPWIAPFDPIEPGTGDRFEAPNGTFFFGTDNLGRDQFSRLVEATRPALAIAIGSVVVGVMVGTIIGMASAYWGGPLDLVVQRVMDGMIALPTLIMALSLVAYLGPGAENVAIAIAVINVPIANRLIRGDVLSIKEEVYIEAARAVGASDWRIMYRHIAPNTVASILVLMSNQFAWAIIIAASLSFLGIGVPPPTPSWGLMLSIGATEYAVRAPWMAISSGVIILLTILSFSMVGDDLRDLFDPRMSSGSRAATS